MIRGMPSRRATLLAVPCAVAAFAVPALALAQQDGDPEQPSSAELFETAITEDDKTTSTVKGLLERDVATIDRAPAFGDLTGDGRADAVVRVVTGGTAGAIAVYVLSTDGLEEDAALRVVYRNQQLDRVVARISSGALLLTVPVWKRGDDPVRPSSYEERGYLWNASSKSFRRTSRRTVAAPVAPAAPQQP